MGGQMPFNDKRELITGVRTVTGADTSVQASDTLVTMANGASDYSILFGPESSEPLPDHWFAEFGKTGSGDVTCERGTGVVFEGLAGDVDIKIDGARGAAVCFRRITENTFEYFGNWKI